MSDPPKNRARLRRSRAVLLSRTARGAEQHAIGEAVFRRQSRVLFPWPRASLKSFRPQLYTHSDPRKPRRDLEKGYLSYQADRVTGSKMKLKVCCVPGKRRTGRSPI